MSASLLLVLAIAAPLQTPGPAVLDPDDPRILVWYDFDGEDVETGPWTLTAYEDAQGSVVVTTRQRLSGWRSVEIRDVAGDGDFAELQGFFRELDSGTLYVHFALMLAHPGEPANVALAGPSHFRLVRDGIAIWLKIRDGHLLEVTAGEDRELIPLDALTWYGVDLAYHVEKGAYDLEVRSEAGEVLASERDVPNAVGLPGSRVHKFSFIGDTPGRDRSDAVLWVDDLLLVADRPVPRPGPFVAPGRRMLFVDLYRHYREEMLRHPGCPPPLGPDDFGFAEHEAAALRQQGLLEAYDALADRRATDVGAPVPEPLRDRFRAMTDWARGCAAPRRCEGGACAAVLFEAAERLVPGARLYPMSRVLALAEAGRWPEADDLLLEIHRDWARDPRFPALAASLGAARGDLDSTEAWLARADEYLPDTDGDPALSRLWRGEWDQSLARDLRAAFPADWRAALGTALAAEQRYYLTLWRQGPDAAASFATRLVARLEGAGVPPGRWLELRGDALFEAGETVAARESYEAALEGLPDPAPIWVKLSDVHFVLGDLEAERAYRERVHGSLRH